MDHLRRVYVHAFPWLKLHLCAVYLRLFDTDGSRMSLRCSLESDLMKSFEDFGCGHHFW